MIFRDSNATVFPADTDPAVIQAARDRGEDFQVLPPFPDFVQLKIARFIGDPTGFRFDPNATPDPARAGQWVRAERGYTRKFVEVDLRQAYLIEDDPYPRSR